MIDRNHKLPVTEQCRLLQLSRSSLYYRAQPVSAAELALLRRLDELHLQHPFAGARMLRDLLRQEGHQIGRKRVTSLMRKLGIEALYRKPNTSRKAAAAAIYPYLLGNLCVERANQVWAADITYIPMRTGFVYLVAIIDWHSRRVLAHRLSNTMTTDFCLEALQEALSKYGCPEIFNTDQGAQFTSADFTDTLKAHGIRISMDGRGRWIDNVFVERLWRSLKYEEVYLHAYESVAEARSGITRYLEFYNRRRPHRAHASATPDSIYFAALAREDKAAA